VDALSLHPGSVPRGIIALRVTPSGEDEEEFYINKLDSYNPRNYVKNTHFYVSVNITDKIAHYRLIDGGSGPNVIYKVIMEELGISCTNFK
jgi:hypothetical protein